MDRIVAEVIDAAARDDRAALIALLHPYLHWTEAGRTLRGRNNVFARLEAGPPLTAPASYELRDGQVYRWNAG
ncbi:nuclear transport factor 2 family protein [Actinoplanes sp. TBRC 11911]|uniref:nuclear transport factor 2 family protein n=1 Tax=Actinoplanes sp. TBRC 11911 TaxID=2729386 RepID=UPI00145D194C|nr:nuclear transport factor 2 family protein [Actinoplanes sp. TBRC 11911]NMO56346.1 nuclear transport factor 2 family protein [Actinoplanes sp. TBRC 11911]